MHPIRKQRLQIVVLIVLVTLWPLIVYTLGQNANYFFTSSQIMPKKHPWVSA